MKRTLFTVIGTTFAIGAQAQLPYSDDFNTDTSANYLVLAEDNFNVTADVAVTFAFDYSTFVDGSDSHTIPVAPNTPDSSQIGLKLEANINSDNGGAGEEASVNIFPLDGASPLNIPAGTNYRMLFDLWMNLGGPATTEFIEMGVNMSGNFVNWRDSLPARTALALR